MSNSFNEPATKENVTRLENEFIKLIEDDNLKLSYVDDIKEGEYLGKGFGIMMLLAGNESGEVPISIQFQLFPTDMLNLVKRLNSEFGIPTKELGVTKSMLECVDRLKSSNQDIIRPLIKELTV